MKCIIVDDEPIARMGIKDLVECIPELELLKSFENAKTAGEFMKDNPVDLIFLDIQMPGITGIEFAKGISKTTLVIFTTAYAEFALDSYEVVENDSIFIKSDRRFFKVSLKDILFIEGLKDYVIIQTGKQRLITHVSLKAIHELLPQKVFLRASRSYIINKDRIDSFSNNDIFIDKYEIAISNYYRDSFFKQLMK